MTVCKYFPGNACVLLILLLFTGIIGTDAQMLDTRVSVQLDSGSLDKSILKLQQTTGFPFAYETSGLAQLPAQGRAFKNERLGTVLHFLLDGTGYFFEEKHDVIIIGPSDKRTREVKGVIEDKITGKRMEGVAVYDLKNIQNGTYTDHDGYFSLPAASDTLKLRLSYLSYKPVEIALHATDAPMILIKMDTEPNELDTVLVVMPSDITPFSPLSKVSFPVGNQLFLPGFNGDIDLLAMTRLTPGLQQAYDGTGNIIVRGGAPDQNLLLIDDANIYGASHLFGLLSSVNTRAVKNVEIYKGSFPARYGGRISSVWDVTMKAGNLEQFHGSISPGTMASDIMIEGPLVKNKTSFLLAGRTSYHDAYVRMFTPGLVQYFQDVSLKLYHRFSDKDHLYFTGYASEDNFRLSNDEKDSLLRNHSIALNTRNEAAALKWRHYYSNRLSTSLVFTYSKYRLMASEQYDVVFPWDTGMYVTRSRVDKNGLSDAAAKFTVKYRADNIHELEAGAGYTRHVFIPYNSRMDWVPSDTFFFPRITIEQVINDKPVREMDFFVEDNLKIPGNLKASAGIHLNKYFYSATSYFSIQPRISICQQISSAWFVNAAYARMQQGLHRLSISQTSLPVDLWIPSTHKVMPQFSDLTSIGVYGKWQDVLNLSIEAYYKGMNHVAELLIKPVDSSVGTEEWGWDKEIATGRGTAYGIEFSARKTKGRYRGWGSYALSWADRTLPEVNNGLTFPYKYDRRHSLNLVNTYKIRKNLELSAVFSFQSKPRPPVLIIKSADLSNAAEILRYIVATMKLTAYHRLDLGINWQIEHREALRSTLNLSVLNVYNRRNDFFYFSSSNSNELEGTILMPVSVALSYILSF